MLLKNNLLKSFMVVSIVSLGFATSTMARPDDGALILSVFGIVNENVKEVTSEERDKSYNFGFGGFVEANVNGILGIETGLMYVKRQYEYSAAGSSLVQQVNRLHVPVVVKFWPTNYISLGAGPFVSFKTGSVNTALNIGGVDVGSIDSSADDDVEFGYDLTAGLNFAVAEKTGIFIEARYSSPFEKENSEDYEELSALAGVKIQL